MLTIDGGTVVDYYGMNKEVMYLSVLFYVFNGDGFEHVGLIVEERETPQPGGGEGCLSFLDY